MTSPSEQLRHFDETSQELLSYDNEPNSSNCSTPLHKITNNTNDIKFLKQHLLENVLFLYDETLNE